MAGGELVRVVISIVARGDPDAGVPVRRIGGAHRIDVS
jgi:hypothetical protein